MSDNDTNVLKLPYDPWKKWDDSITSYEIYLSTRLAWVDTVNMVNMGIYELTEQEKQSLWRLNAFCVEHGYDLLDVNLGNRNFSFDTKQLRIGRSFFSMLDAINDNDIKVLKLPYEIGDGWDDSLSDEENFYQAKLAWVDKINRAVIGVRELTEEDKQSLWQLNALCIKYGHDPLDVDLENL